MTNNDDLFGGAFDFNGDGKTDSGDLVRAVLAGTARLHKLADGEDTVL